jgi:hypothetical protein
LRYWYKSLVPLLTPRTRIEVNVSSASNDAKVLFAPLQQAAAGNKLHGADLRDIQVC